MLVEGDSLLPTSISDLGQVLNLYGPQASSAAYKIIKIPSQL